MRRSDFEMCANNLKRLTFTTSNARPENHKGDCMRQILERAQASAQAKFCGRAAKFPIRVPLIQIVYWPKK